MRAGADKTAAVHEGYRFGSLLDGRELLPEQIAKLVTFFAMQAALLAASGDFPKAAAVASAALGVLPGHPQLLDLMANLWMDGGLPALALGCVTEAARRRHLLSPELTARLDRTIAELDTKLLVSR